MSASVSASGFPSAKALSPRACHCLLIAPTCYTLVVRYSAQLIGSWHPLLLSRSDRGHRLIQRFGLHSSSDRCVSQALEKAQLLLHVHAYCSSLTRPITQHSIAFHRITSSHVTSHHSSHPSQHGTAEHNAKRSTAAVDPPALTSEQPWPLSSPSSLFTFTAASAIDTCPPQHRFLCRHSEDRLQRKSWQSFEGSAAYLARAREVSSSSSQQLPLHSPSPAQESPLSYNGCSAYANTSRCGGGRGIHRAA